MAAVWVGNFDFEHELASAAYAPTDALRRLNCELAWHLSALTEAGDGIEMPHAPCPEFVAHWNALTGGDVTIVASSAECGRFERIEPWGRSRRIHRSSIASPTSEAVRLANSRRWSVTQELELGVVLPGSAIVTSIASLTAAVESLAQQQDRDIAQLHWVVKAEFGMSARERVLGRGIVLSVPTRRWIEKRLATGEWLVFEPWLERVSEVGILLMIPPPGSIQTRPELVAVTELITDASGRYCGTRCSSNDPPSCWQPAVETARHMTERLRAIGYFGPVGIDAMSYPTAGSDVPSIRPVQDINARWTMGFVATRLAQRLAPGRCSSWINVSTQRLCEQLGGAATLDFERKLLATFGLDLTKPLCGVSTDVRVLRTSPLMIGELPTRQTGLLISASNRDEQLAVEQRLLQVDGQPGRVAQ